MGCLQGKLVPLLIFFFFPVRPQYLDNVTQCLNVLPSVGVMTVFLTPMQVVDGDGK